VSDHDVHVGEGIATSSSSRDWHRPGGLRGEDRNLMDHPGNPRLRADEKTRIVTGQR